MEVPDYFIGSYFGVSSDYQPAIADQNPGEQFVIEDLLDFSNNEDDGAAITASENVAGGSLDSPTLTVGDSCNSSFSAAEQQFSGDLCVPCEDLAELEWLSNFVEDSFSADRELQSQSLQVLSSSETARNGAFPGKARSKRSRAAPGDWTTRLLHLVNPKKESSESTLRKCLHCAAEKTPQWRTGPMGPKTLCNACGVRFKSGRLVAEYRPAASPTFVSAKHSNSHRKVLELRRQKEFQRSPNHQFLGQTSIFGVSNGADDFLIHRHAGPDFSHLI